MVSELTFVWFSTTTTSKLQASSKRQFLLASSKGRKREEVDKWKSYSLCCKHKREICAEDRDIIVKKEEKNKVHLLRRR